MTAATPVAPVAFADECSLYLYGNQDRLVQVLAFDATPSLAVLSAAVVASECRFPIRLPEILPVELQDLCRSSETRR